MSFSRVSIYKRDGSFLTTISTQTTRAWVLNDYGECTFDMAQSDAKTLAKYLQIGNLVFVEHETLPNWGGKILPDITWNDDETVTFTAYSGEALLMLRRSAWGGVWDLASAGALFRRMVNYANRAEDLLVRIGSIWEGGTRAQDTMDGKSIYSHVRDLVDNRSNDYNLDVERDDAGHIYWLAHYYERRGSVVSGIWLKEGLNIEKRSSALRVQRWPVNDLLGIGDGSDASRPTSVQQDLASIALYGLMQGSEDFAGNTQATTVANNTRAKLAEVKNPRNTFKITALTTGGDIFPYLRLGNVLNLKMQTVGFDGNDGIGTQTQVRIKAMKYSDRAEKCELTVDEVI